MSFLPNVLQDQNSSFSAIIPNLQVAWDSTSLGLYKECPRKYYYSIILGWTPRAESVHLKFGQVYHAALEAYDHARAAGGDFDSGVRAAVRAALEGTVVRNKLGTRPWASDDPNKNRWTLLRSVVWYLDKFKDDPARTIILANGKPAVELSFRYDAGMKFASGEPLFMCGHLDRIVELNGNHYILDRKTTKNTLDEKFFPKFNPDNQMTNYTVAADIVWSNPVKGIIIDGAQVAVTFTRFLRGFTLRHKTELEEWTGETKRWIKRAEDSALASLWDKNDKSCGNYGGCPFREVCSKAPSIREEWLVHKFHKRVWDPLQVRGDV